MIRRMALTIALPLVSLAVGVGIGCLIWRTSPVETIVLPPESLGAYTQQRLREGCAHNAVFGEFTMSDSMLNGVRVQRRVERLSVEAVPLSDRGIICRLSASVRTRKSQLGGVSLERMADEHMTYIVAINGDSEVVTEDFAKALLTSKTVHVMASNLGNDGTVIPKPKVATFN
ncbi:hypothetical protein N0754_18760 [Pseudomonas aeruginosa]|nr:hypothetical protein [Pseudomonas aeruginosa]MCS9764278.1 hypothetical protein [Pseudomonas aeruginosa]MCS9820454.1 hypothetical protein [Pseudomonas aeruginosa]MCT0241035.1 hypothetical protein [Pseudomonas aeruginosa]MCT0528488.1 hypothetical protein [Pseudomonas aeruginosa]